MIEIAAVAFKRYGELSVFVQSIVNQSCQDWVLTVIHDGPDSDFDAILGRYRDMLPSKIRYYSTRERYNDFGHSLRERAIKEVRGDYLLLTNADNYFVPRAIEYIKGSIDSEDPDIAMFDMVHSHCNPGGRALPEYSYFKTSYSRKNIDISAAVVRSSLARLAGFRDKSHDGDATYFEDLVRAASPQPVRIAKINRVLLVHN